MESPLPERSLGLPDSDTSAVCIDISCKYFADGSIKSSSSIGNALPLNPNWPLASSLEIIPCLTRGNTHVATSALDSTVNAGNTKYTLE